MGFPYVTSAHWTFKVTPLLKIMTNWGEGTVAVSDDIKEYLINNYGIPEDQIVVTVNGIDTDKFSKNTNYEDVKEEFSLSNTSNRIVYISRLDESRALVAKQLVSISRELNETIKDLEIVIVGGGDSFDEIIGVSRSALEAMAAEKPTIVAGNEGYIGIFDESKLKKGIETNFCCRGLQNSSEELLKKDIIDLMQKNDESLANQGLYNREIVQKYYSVEKMTNDCEKVYKKVLEKHKKA